MAADSQFENLLPVNSRVQEAELSAPLDTGAGMTVAAGNIPERLGAAADNNIRHAGNDSGPVRTLQTAVLSNVRLGDICIERLRVIVAEDADFPAGMPLGRDVISRYCRSCSAESNALSVCAAKKRRLFPILRSGRALPFFRSILEIVLKPDPIPDIPARRPALPGMRGFPI